MAQIRSDNIPDGQQFRRKRRIASPLQKRFRQVYNPHMNIVKAPNLSLLTKAHDNKWVAFSLDYKKLLGVAESLMDLKSQIGKVKAIVMHVLPADVAYAPTSR